MSLKIDKVQLDIIINNDQSRAKLREIDEQLKLAVKGLKGLKEGTAEWAAQDAKIKTLKTQFEAAQREIGLTGMTVKELRKHMNELKLVMNNMNPNLPEYKLLQQELKETDARYKQLTTGAKSAETTIQKVGLSFKKAFAAFTVGGLVAQGISSLISGIKSFVSESSTKFQEAESISKKLEFAVTSVGNEGSAAFEKLNRQAEKLKGYFDDEDIRNAQTDLINYGLSAEEVYTLMPKLIDAAAQSGRELTDVSDAVIRGIEGQGRGLKTLGIELTTGASETQNLADINKQLEKFAGGATDALETETGALKLQQIALEDTQEKIGKITIKFQKFWNDTKLGFLNLTNDLLYYMGIVDEASDKNDTDSKNKIETMKSLTEYQKKYNKTYEDLSEILSNDVSKAWRDYLYWYDLSIKTGSAEYNENVKTFKQKYEHLLAVSDFNKELIKQKEELNKPDTSDDVGIIEKIKKQIKSLEELRDTATSASDISSYNTQIAALEKQLDSYTGKIKEEKDAYEKLTESISKYEKLITSLNATGETEKAAAAAVTLQGLKDQKKAIDDLTASQQTYAAEKAKEETDVSKIAANTPNTQLEQKKAELVDYSQFEIEQAKNVAKAKTAINTEYQENQDALREKAKQLTEQAEKELISTVADLWKTSLDKKFDNETHALDVAKENELANKKLTDAQKEAIEQKYAAQNLKIRQQKAKDEKLINIGKIGADTALAIMKTIAELGGVGALTPPGIALIAAMTAMGLEQAAVVAAQPIPQYATGKYPVIGASDGKRYNASVSSDTSTRLLTQPTILAGEQMPEWIIDGPTTKKMMDYPGLVNAIYSLSGRVPQYAAGKYPTQTTASSAPIISSDPNMLLLLKEISEKLDNPTRAKVVYSDFEKVQEKVQDTRNRYNL